MEPQKEEEKKILDDALHKYVEVIIRYAYDISTYEETNICLDKLNHCKKKYYINVN